MSTTSGKLFTATLGAGPTIITGLLKGDLQEQGDELDSTDSDSAPYMFTDIGCTGMKGTLEGHFRAAGMQFPALKVGSTLTTLKVFPRGTVSPGTDLWIFPLAIILPGSVSIELRGKVTFTINFASQGKFYQPGDTFP